MKNIGWFKIFILSLVLIFTLKWFYNYLFELKYVCKAEDERLYILKLSPDGIARLYDEKKSFISSTKYYSTGLDSFIGENGWEGNQSLSNGMNIKYRDKEGKLTEFYYGCDKIQGILQR
jgi:hypothetical protein